MPAEEIRQKLLGKFREVTADRVEKISSHLLELERGTGTDALQEVARELHTLKGESRMMGFIGLSQVVHAAEDLLKSLPPTGAGTEIDALLKACDALPSLLDAPPDGGKVAAELVERLHLLVSAGGSGQPSTPKDPPKKESRRAEEPGESKAADGHPPGRGVAKRSGTTRIEKPNTSIRVDVDRLDEIAALTGDLLVDGARAQRRVKELAALLLRWNRLSDHMLAADQKAEGEEDQIRAAQRIEGEVHLLRSDTFRFLRRHADAVSAMQSQLGLLADRVGAARLVPLQEILATFPRAARDLAREQGKEVECTVKGGEAAVDKAILLSLTDPLVHLLRNSVDHGIEPADERERAGKPRAGQVVITARTEGDLLALTVVDDGRGIDVRRVREKAVQQGLIGNEQASALSDRAALDLVFLPGLSTRDGAGELSGRGVGLDVVRKKVVSLGGSVLVESELGRGTRFMLRVPQSLSLMKVLMVCIDDDVYGIPAVDVEGVGRIELSEVTEVAGIRVTRHHERLMPVVALGPLLGLNGGPRGSRPAAVFVWHGTEGAALVVDGLHGEREVAVKAPGAFVKGMRFVAGAAALEDGRVALLLSTPDIVAAARKLASPAFGRAPDSKRYRVLVVDDSAIAREAEAALLRSLGHEVEEARDGEEGWQKLQAGGYQVLLTDVQMPVLDGIDLTRRVKSVPRFAGLPVVILSSLSTPEDRRRGVNAGADAYLVKGELDAETLSSTLERLCGVGR